MVSSQYPKHLAAEQAAGLLRAAGRIVVCGHVNPDGDCIGSMAAMVLALRALGKTVCAVAATPLPLKYRFFSHLIAVPGAEDFSECDLVVVLDTPSRARIDLAPDYVPVGVPLLCIDHHPVTAADFDYVLEDRTEAAVGCILHQVFQMLPVSITPAIADGLYTALITDTGRFTNQNTTVRVFELALQLVRAGAQPVRVATAIYQSATPAQLRLLGAVLETLDLFNSDRGALLYISDAMRNACKATEADCEDFVTYARSIHGVRAAALLTEQPGGTAVKISLRSNTPEYDMSTFAAMFGGGGHPCASGATVTGSLERFLPEFKLLFEQFIAEICS